MKISQYFSHRPPSDNTLLHDPEPAPSLARTWGKSKVSLRSKSRRRDEIRHSLVFSSVTGNERMI